MWPTEAARWDTRSGRSSPSAAPPPGPLGSGHAHLGRRPRPPRPLATPTTLLPPPEHAPACACWSLSWGCDSRNAPAETLGGCRGRWGSSEPEEAAEQAGLSPDLLPDEAPGVACGCFCHLSQQPCNQKEGMVPSLPVGAHLWGPPAPPLGPEEGELCTLLPAPPGPQAPPPGPRPGAFKGRWSPRPSPRTGLRDLLFQAGSCGCSHPLAGGERLFLKEIIIAAEQLAGKEPSPCPRPHPSPWVPGGAQMHVQPQAPLHRPVGRHFVLSRGLRADPQCLEGDPCSSGVTGPLQQPEASCLPAQMSLRPLGTWGPVSALCHRKLSFITLCCESDSDRHGRCGHRKGESTPQT